MNHKWEYKQILEICTVERGGSPRPIDSFITESEDGINWIKIGDTDESMYITKTAQKIKREGMKKSRYVKPGDFLLSNSMSFGRPYILKIDGCIHDGWLVLRDTNDMFDKRFLYYYLSAPTTYAKFKSMAVGGVVNNLNSEMVRHVKIPIPPLEEQEEIASILDKVHELIENRKKQLSLLDDLIKSRFVEMFGNPMDFKRANTTFTKTVIFNPKKSEIADKKQLEVSFVPMECVGTDGSFSIQRNGLINEFYKGYTYFKDDDVLIAKITPCFENGKSAIAKGCANGIGFGTTEFHVARPIEGQSTAEWVQYLFKNNELHNYASTKMSGAAGQKRIQTPFFEELPVYLPPYSEQIVFSNFVTQVNKSKFAVQKSLDELQVLYDSLMQKYFG